MDASSRPSLSFLVFTPLVLSLLLPGVLGGHKQCALRPMTQCPVPRVARAHGKGLTLPSLSLFLGGRGEQNAQHGSTSALSETDGSHVKAASCWQRFPVASLGARLIRNWELGLCITGRGCGRWVHPSAQPPANSHTISGAAGTAQGGLEKQEHTEFRRVEELPEAAQPRSGTARHS